MLSSKTFLTLILGLTLGACGGFWAGNAGARTAVVCGPYSDEFGSALSAIDEAKAKLEDGNTNVIEDFDEARDHLQRCKDWTERYSEGNDLEQPITVTEGTGVEKPVPAGSRSPN